MNRTVQILIALLTTVLLAGCNDPVPAGDAATTDPLLEAAAVEEPEEVAPTLPEDLAVPGATLVSNDGATAVFEYSGEAPSQTGIWIQFVGPVQTSDVRDSLDLPIPSDLGVQVNLTLSWDSTMDLDLYLKDSAGTRLCASENGQGAMNPAYDMLVGMESSEECGYAMASPIATPDLWTVDMEVFHNDNGGEPYRLTITYRLL